MVYFIVPLAVITPCALGVGYAFYYADRSRKTALEESLHAKSRKTLDTRHFSLLNSDGKIRTTIPNVAASGAVGAGMFYIQKRSYLNALKGQTPIGSWTQLLNARGPFVGASVGAMVVSAYVAGFVKGTLDVRSLNKQLEGLKA